MNPVTSPTAMAVGNAAVVIYGLLESFGVLNVLGGNKWVAGALTALGAVNSIAHAFSPPAPGPLAK